MFVINKMQADFELSLSILFLRKFCCNPEKVKIYV